MDRLNELKVPGAPDSQAASPRRGAKKSPAMAPAPSPASGGGNVEAQVKSVGNEIRILKQKHQELNKVETAKAAVPAAGGDVEVAIKTVGDEPRTLEEKLKAEGVSGKSINEQVEIKALVEKLTALKAGGAPDTAAHKNAQAAKSKEEFEAEKLADNF